MSFHALPTLIASFLVTLSATALDSIGWHYDGVGDDTLEASDVAGAQGFAQGNWNNHVGIGQGVGALPLHLKDNLGRATTATVSEWTLTRETSWFHGQSASPNEKLMNSFADQEPSLTISGVPENYQVDGYSVVVYYGNNEGPSPSQLSLTGTVSGAAAKSILSGDTLQSSYGNVGYVEETGALSGPTNFTVFQNRYDAEFSVSLTGNSNNGFCAIQLVKNSGVTSAPKNPLPHQGSPRVSRNVALSWVRGKFASSYEVFIWRDGDSEPSTPNFVVQENTVQLPGLFQPLATYHWRVKSVNLTSFAVGEQWTFTTSSKSSSQDSIGWNYDGLGDDTLTPETVAGVAPFAQANWNNHAGIGQGIGSLPFSLTNADGGPSGCQVSNWILLTENSWAHYQDFNPNEMLMNSFTDQQPALTFSGVPASYQASGYQVVVYYGNNEGPSTSLLTLNGSLAEVRSRSIITGDTSKSSYRNVGFQKESGELLEPTNHTVFSGLHDPGFTIAFTGNNNNGFSAVQIVRTRTPYEVWTSDYGLDGSPGAESSLSADPDADGRSNFYEYAFHGDPLQSARSGEMATIVEENPFALVLTIAVRTGNAPWIGTSPTSTRDGITYTIEGCLDLNFSALVPVVRLTAPITTNLPDLSNTGYEYQSFTLQNLNAGTGKGFLRARAVLVP